MAISVPVLPTPALQGDRHRLDEPGHTYNTYLLPSVAKSQFLADLQ